jgi:preprotein translocase subunit SecA
MRKFLDNLFGTESDRFIKGTHKTLELINGFEPALQALSDEELQAKTTEFKARLAGGELMDAILPEAFAVVREASRRTLGLRHYDVQMIGGLALCKGSIAEMRTGEGKTLVGTLPVYVMALTGKGVHVVTVNDYLSRRDAQWMGQLYDFLGLSVGIINDQKSFLYDRAHLAPVDDVVRDAESSFKVFEEFLRPSNRREAYQADITYGTQSQFGFDYLRDNTQLSVNGLVQRGHFFALVDEVDSVLIDEARVPLILSAPAADAGDLYKRFAQVASVFEPEVHYTIDEKMRAIQLTDAGIASAEQALQIGNLYTPEHVRLIHHLETAVRARALFHKDQEYVVRGDEVIIVDAFTGRMQEGRRYSDGLHQAIEAKEGVRIREESRTIASITYQNYFKLYRALAGMTGTALTSEEEFRTVYGLDTIAIPTHRSIARIDHDDLIFMNEAAKVRALANKIRELHEKKQPVLIGTVSVEKNQELSDALRKANIPHELLNAKNHDNEAAIIAQAGRPGAVTIATNMAGRGVDIKLGGVHATPDEVDMIRGLGGLYVIGTERHEARRIDNQLRGRAGRQGDPGQTQFFVSLDDQLMRVFGGDRVKSMISSLGVSEDEPIRHGMITRSLESAQRKIEGFHFDSRKNVLAFDDVLSHHRTTIYSRRNDLLHGDRNVIDEALFDVTRRVPESADALSAKKESIGEDLWYAAARRIMLVTTDRLWMDHLERMDDTRQSVNLRAVGQREPIVEYKRESLQLFRELEEAFAREVADLLSRLEISETATAESLVQDAPMPLPMSVSMLGRNDKVKIKKDDETMEVKMKQLEKYLSEGWEVVS